MGSDSDDGDDYESPATLLAVVIAHSPNARHTLLVLVESEESRRLRHVVVDARDRLERGGRQPSLLEAHTAWFPSPHLQSLICVCAEMLWCSELVHVRSGTIAVVDCFSRELCSKLQSV